MADLVTADIVLRVFRNTAVEPSDVSDAAVQEIIAQQFSTDSFTNDAFVLPANAIDTLPPSFPHIPYDGIFFMATDIDVKININGQGDQVVSPGGFVSFASVSSILFTNDIIPTGGTVTVPANIRYFAARIVGTAQAIAVGAPQQAFSHTIATDGNTFTIPLPQPQPDATYTVLYGIKTLPGGAAFPLLTFPVQTTTTFDIASSTEIKAGTVILFSVQDIP